MARGAALRLDRPISVLVLLPLLLVALGGCTNNTNGGGAPVERAEAEPTTTASTTSSSPAPVDATSTSTTAVAVAPQAEGCPTPVARRSPDPDRPTYDVSLSADPRTGVVAGSQTVAFTPDLPTDRLVFRLWANGPRPGSVGTSISVGDVTGASGSLRVEQPDPTTLVALPDRTLQPGERVTVTMRWQLQVQGPVNDRISRQADSLRLGSFLPLLAWQPGLGWAVEPPTSGFAEATTSPTADWMLQVTAPEGFDVVASGVQTAPGEWRAEAARDVAVSVGRFTVARATAMAPEAVEVVVAVHDDADRPSDYLDQIVDQLETFAAWFGPYPWPTYQVSVTPSLSGGIEFPMHVLQGPDTDDRTTPHEVAHMWFYGLVGNNQGLYPWLDEGLATYVEGRYLGTLDSMAGRSIPGDGRGRAGAPMTYWEDRASSYYRSVYVQPAAALHRLGDPQLVDCALARYVAENAHTIARPEDLSRALDAVFPDWRTALAPAGLP